MIIKVKPAKGFEKQLINGVSSNTIQLLDNRLAINAQNVFIAIGDYIASVFEKTDVAKSLRGVGSVDLPAHFGLSDSSANALVDEMVNILINSVSLGSKITPNGGALTIKAVATDWEKYTNLPGAKYISKSSGIEIPVIEWLLIDPEIDIGQAAYDIIFRGEISGFDVQIQKNSRSGRAIMASLQELGGSGGYVLPDIIRQKSGMNFIEFAIGQKDVARRCAEILMERIL